MAKHWPESEIYGDIRTITNTNTTGNRTPTSGANTNGQTIHQGQEKQPQPWISGQIDLLTGGFPCQPFSAAGKRKGTADDRHLWPEMFRVIQLTKPTWIIGENVPGIINIENGMVFEQICLDLENEGYQVQPFIIPACSVNAPHRRDRVWIVANRQGGRKRSSQSKGSRTGESQKTIRDRNRDAWEQDWLEVATELCSLDDGLPVELGELKLTQAGHRREQLKAYGNAIVPAVAVVILRSIKQTYENM